MNALNRYQAFAIHLLSSSLIACCSAALVFLIWYPSPLAAATGVTDIFLLVLAVDVSLGPILTLVVFNPAKKELKWDLMFIATLQIAALLYGIHTVFIARPVYEVFNQDRFDLVYANDLTDDKLAKAPAEFKQLPLFGPQRIAAKSPENAEARNKLLFSALAGGDDLPQTPEYYIAYEQQQAQALSRVLELDKLIEFNPDQKAEVAALSQKYASISAGVGYVPLKAKTQDMTVIIRKDNAAVLEIVNLRPWKS